MRSRSSTVSGTKGGFTPRNHSNIYNTTASGPHQPHQPSSPALYASSSTQKNINMASEDSPNASGDAPSQRQQQIRILQEKRNNRISAIFNAPPVPIHATTPDTPQVPIISIHKSDSKAIPIISPTSRSLVVPSDAENASNSD
ncbi:hypothetical protein AX774_g3893 [Zancudomyces culisetae]|uniref:Uncharacterized protein n=1 Tax=Zancudomyces culisetae TaxID=1213189 RepID=A0A1R1PNT9_ZANCU|nr:hypothetical protein AX774_g3893 [Zancudomyces culisetae]|eukprot:OMH82620.1 hypothetical protein AX774_g3893 [Zancudomyces culisetae]